MFVFSLKRPKSAVFAPEQSDASALLPDRRFRYTHRERERDGGGGCRVSVVVLDRPGLHYLTAVGSTCCLLLRFVRLGSVAVVELELAAFCAILGVQLNTCVQQRFVAVAALR
jgi:hypothetical protein